MKKLVLFAVAVVAISFASCGNKAAENAPVNQDSLQNAAQTTVDTVAAPVDSAAVAK